MKKVFYESWIAKHLLFSGYSTITLFAWVFTKWPEASPASLLLIMNVSMPDNGQS